MSRLLAPASAGATPAQAAAIESNTKAIADLERDFLLEPNYWVSGNSDARTFVAHLHPAAQPTGATRIRLIVAGSILTQNLTAGDTDYAFNITAIAAANINSNLRGATTVRVTLQYLDASNVLATQNVLLRVVAAPADTLRLVRYANEAALPANVPANTIAWFPEA